MAAGVLIVVVVLVAGDLVARSTAEDRIAARVRASTGAESATARIDSFPFLPRLAVSGQVGRIVITARGVPVGLLRLDRVTLVAHDVRLDRHELVVDGQARVTLISSADVTVVVTPADLSTAVHHRVTLAGDTLTVEVGGVALHATIGVRDGHFLTLTAGGFLLGALNLARTPLVPDCGLSLQGQAGQITLTCHVAPVPASMIAGLSKAR